MKLTFSDLVAERDMHRLNHHNVITTPMEAFKLKIIEEMKSTAYKTNRSLGIIDLHQWRITDFNSVHNHRFEHPVVVLSKEDNIGLLNDYAHPETHYFNVETEVIYFRHMNKVPYNDRKNLVSVSLRKLKNKFGKYDIYLIRIYVIKCDDLGLPWLLLVEVELMDTYKADDFYPHRVFYVANEVNPAQPSLLESYNKHPLTKVELKVLMLSSQNIKIEEIALLLGTSQSNIKAIRSNILRKLNSYEMPQACLLAKKLKIINEEAA